MKSKIWTWLIVLVVLAALMWVASALTGPEGTKLQGLTWLLWVVIAGVVIYILYFATSQSEAWAVGTRQVVYMAIGAALYGIFSWLFNGTVFVVPSVSLVSIRPAIALPIFFGYAFGPVVGFFTGAVGNILGDFITGWGVYPVWDIGNGLIGLVAGLVMLFPDRRKSLSTLTWLVGVLVLAAIGIILASPVIRHPWTGEQTNYLPWVWVVVIGGVLALAARFLMKPLGEDTAAINLWGALGIIIGIGFAAFADIWVNGYTFFVAMVGEFIPAAGPNLINAAILAPILLAAYKAVQARTGR
ncbi:MAG: ECF transporter S component [Anaerolineales bacterium]|nr:ECF transporter S component [Anaerolineales bacterium]